MFANLQFEGCSFDGSVEGTAAIVEVEKCPSSSPDRNLIQFHHVRFKKNALVRGAGLRVHSPSCSSLELIDFKLEDNVCDGYCGVILSDSNRLKDVRVQRTTSPDSMDSRTAVFDAPPGSQTSVEDMDAVKNACPVLHVRSASLNMSRGAFQQNSVKTNEEHDVTPSVRLTNATVFMDKCFFRENEAENGGAFAAAGTNLTVINSVFEENAAEQGGVIHLKASSLEIQSCEFSSNHALGSGGVVLAIESHLVVSDGTFEKNSAAVHGGCFSLNKSSSLELVDSTLNWNNASHGGVASFEKQSTGTLTDSAIHSNRARIRGGAYFVQDSALSVQRCRFSHGAGKSGGGIYALSSEIRVEGVNASSNRAQHNGGFINAKSSSVLLQESYLFGNSAKHAGGAVAGWNECRVEVSNSRFSDHEAKSGGVVCLDGNSRGNLIQSEFTESKVSAEGGVVYLNRSSVESDDCRFFSGRADSEGGLLFAQKSKVSILDSDFIQGSAYGGGCIRLTSESEAQVQNAQLISCDSTRGGAVHLSSSSSGNFINATFRGNMADFGGGSVYVRTANASMTQCRFTRGFQRMHTAEESVQEEPDVGEEDRFDDEEGYADYYWGFYYSSSRHIPPPPEREPEPVGSGGFIRSCCNAHITLNDTVMEDGRAVGDAGCLYASRTTLAIRNTTMHNCTATNNGGAMYLRDSVVADIRNTDVRWSKASYGGGIRAFDVNIVGHGWTMMNNVAYQDGGALSMSRSDIVLKSSLMKNNSAEKSGGVVHLSASTAIFDRCTFLCSRAERGGLIAIGDSGRMDIIHSVLEEGTARMGACVHCSGSRISIRNVTMRHCQATIAGGAIRLHLSSLAEIKESRFVANQAQYGGALDVTGSTFNGSGLIFENNAAVNGGGALFANMSGIVKIVGSQFKSNSARNGGAVHQNVDIVGIFLDTTFVDNWAGGDGGTAYTTESTLRFKRCLFRDSHANSTGGILYSWRGPLVHVKNSELINGTAQSGGCVYVGKGNVTVQKTSIHDCSASKDGGALYLWEGAVSELEELNITANRADNDGGGLFSWQGRVTANEVVARGNTAGDEGGGMLLTESSWVRLKDCHFAENSAHSGGALVMRKETTGALIGVQISDNVAATRGGDCLVETSTLRVTSSRFHRSIARDGGSLFVVQSRLDITDSEFHSGHATSRGGFICSTEDSSLVLERCSMNDSRSNRGGAIVVLGSDLRSRDVEISHGRADEDGGAIMLANASLLLCEDCRLTDNSARRGGAVFLEYRVAQSLSMQLEESIVQNNTAAYGGISCLSREGRASHRMLPFVLGGVHVVGERDSISCNCSPGGGGCGVLAVANTQFLENEAEAAGGAIFADRTAVIRMHCSVQSTHRRFEFYSKKQWLSMQVIESLEDICPAWMDNTAGTYGPDVATYTFDIEKKVFDEKAEDATVVNGSQYTIHGHRSGKKIPAIVLTPVDELGQYPAVGADNRHTVAVVSSPDGFFAGSMTVSLDTAAVSISPSGFAQPGNYTLAFRFEGVDAEDFDITVEVKGCSMGEVPLRNGTFCEPCTSSTYSFLPDEDVDCHPCPENGQCETAVILPNSGYWHKTPCSQHLQRCLTPDACESDRRDQGLGEMTADVDSCDFEESFFQNYTDVQCREVSRLFPISLEQASNGGVYLTGSRGPPLRGVRGVLWKDALVPV